MSIRDIFIIKEAGPFEVIPGGKPSGEPSDPQGILYPADQDQSKKGKLLTSLSYVISNLGDFKTRVEAASDEQLYKLALDMMDTASDLNWALKEIIEDEE